MHPDPHRDDEWLMAWANASWFVFCEHEEYFRPLDVAPPKTLTELAARDQSLRFTGAGIRVDGLPTLGGALRAKLRPLGFSEDDVWIGTEMELEPDGD